MTILIVDDDLTGLDQLSRFLSCNSYDIYTIDKGSRVIEMIINEKQAIDIILLGDTLSESNGHEVLRALRQYFSLTELPIIMLNSRKENEVAIDELQLGANDYVNKPINHKILKTRIDTQIKLKRILHAYRSVQENMENLIKQRAYELNHVNSILASDHKIFQYLLNLNSNLKHGTFYDKRHDSKYTNHDVKNISRHITSELPVDTEFQINSEMLAQLSSILQQVNKKNGQLNARKNSIVKFADWTLDLNAQELKNYDGDEVGLTSYEFQLLSTLVKCAHHVLSREQIMEYLTGRDRLPTDRSIDVLIGKLRKKIETDPHKPDIIKTIRGTGYKFTARVQYC